MVVATDVGGTPRGLIRASRTVRYHQAPGCGQLGGCKPEEKKLELTFSDLLGLSTVITEYNNETPPGPQTIHLKS